MFVLQCFEKEVISRVLLNVILTKRRRRGETRRRNSCRGGGECRENGGGRGVKITCTSGKHRGLTPTCPLPSLLKNTTILKCSLLFYDEIKVRFIILFILVFINDFNRVIHLLRERDLRVHKLWVRNCPEKEVQSRRPEVKDFSPTQLPLNLEHQKVQGQVRN